MIETTKSVKTSTLNGYRPLALRAVWLLLAALTVTIFVTGLQVFAQQLYQQPSQPAPLLEPLGISHNFYNLYVLTHQAGFGLVFVGAAVVIFWRKSDDWLAVLVSLMLITFGINETEAGGMLVAHDPRWHWPVESMQAFGVASLLVILYLFPDGRFVPRWTRSLTAAWLALVLMWLLFPTVPFNYIYGETAEKTPLGSFLVFLFWIGTGIVAQIYRYRYVSTPVQRQQTKWAVYGVVIAFLGGIVRFLPPAISSTLSSPEFRIPYDLLIGFPLGGLFMACWPVAIAIATLRYRLWDIDPLINRTLVYSVLTMTLGGVYVGSIVFSQWLILTYFTSQTRLDSQHIGLTLLLSTLIVATLFLLWQRRIQTLIDRRFYRDKVDFRQAFTRFSNEVRLIIQLPQLLELLVSRVTDLLHIAHSAVYLRDDDDQFRLAESRNLPSNQALQLALSGYLIDLLRRGEVISQPKVAHFPLLVPLIAPRKNGSDLVGVLALGPRLSEQPYSGEDRALLASLANRAGTAIAVARTVEYERQLDAYRNSPLGRAEAFAQTLQARPEMSAVELHRLARQAEQDGAAASLLKNLPQVLADSGRETMAAAAEGYHYVLNSRFAPEMLPIGLHRLIHSLSEGGQRGWLGVETALPIYQRCHDALLANGPAQIGRLAAGGQPERSDHPAEAAVEPAEAGDWLTSLEAVAHALQALQPVAQLFLSYQQAGQLQDKLTYLTQALEQLSIYDHDLLAGLSGPGRLIMAGIINRWRTIASGAIQLQRRQAWLEITPVNRRVLYGEQVALVLAVRNVGLGPAYNATFEILPGNDYRIIDRFQTVAEIEPDQTQRVRFLVRPAACCAFSPKFSIRYDDAVVSGKIWEFHTTIVTFAPQAEFRTIENPYVPGAVLGQDSPVFFGRSELLAFILRQINRGDAVRALVLTGQRRIGKSSLAQQLLSRLEPGYVPVYLDCQRLGVDPGLDSFFYQLAAGIAAGLGCDLPTSDAFRQQPAKAFEYEFLPPMLKEAGQRRLLLIFDEFELLQARVERGRLTPELFSYLRYLMLHEQQFVFVFIGSQRLAQLNPDYWSAFFNVALHRRVGVLTPEEARALITRPVAPGLMYEDLAIDKILRLTGGHPYFLQLVCHTLVDRANDERRGIVDVPHVNRTLADVLELAEPQFLHLWQNRTEAEQTLLQTAAALSRRGELITPATLSDRLLPAGGPSPEIRVTKVLMQLQAQELLQATHPGADTYVFVVDLLRLWISQRYGG